MAREEDANLLPVPSPVRQNFESLFESSVRLRLARALVRFPDKEFTGRELARASQMSHTSASQAMEALVRTGLALKKIIGPAYVYRANKESYLFESMRRWLSIEEGLERDLLGMLRERLQGVASAVTIFGSFARGTAGPDSDLDLVVVTSEPEKARRSVEGLGTQIFRRYGIRLSPRVLSDSEYREKADLPYLKSAIREGIPIVGRPLSRVGP